MDTCDSPAPLRAGEVLLAKYRGTSRTHYYWAKVVKVYSNGNQVLCDVSWLRPQAGTPGGAAYVLHDGYDETQHREGLSVSTELRRPCAEDLKQSAPPGAVASPPTHQVAGNPNVQSGSHVVKQGPLKPAAEGAKFSDLLGDVTVETRDNNNPPMNLLDVPADGSRPLANSSQMNNTWANFDKCAQEPYRPQVIQHAMADAPLHNHVLAASSDAADGPDAFASAISQHSELSHVAENVGKDWERVGSEIERLRAELDAAMAADFASTNQVQEKLPRVASAEALNLPGTTSLQHADSCLSMGARMRSRSANSVLSRGISDCGSFRLASCGSFRLASVDSEDPWASAIGSPCQSTVFATDALVSQRILSCGQVIDLQSQSASLGDSGTDEFNVYDMLHALRSEKLPVPEQSALAQPAVWEDHAQSSMGTSTVAPTLMGIGCVHHEDPDLEVPSEENTIWPDVPLSQGIDTFFPLDNQTSPEDLSCLSSRLAAVQPCIASDVVHVECVNGKGAISDSKARDAANDATCSVPSGLLATTIFCGENAGKASEHNFSLQEVHNTGFSATGETHKFTADQPCAGSGLPQVGRVDDKKAIPDDKTKDVPGDASCTFPSELPATTVFSREDGRRSAEEHGSSLPEAHNTGCRLTEEVHRLPTVQPCAASDSAPAERVDDKRAKPNKKREDVPSDATCSLLSERVATPTSEPASAPTLPQTKKATHARSKKSHQQDVSQQAYSWWQDTIANPLKQFSQDVADGYNRIVESIQEGDEEDDDSEEEEDQSSQQDAIEQKPMAPSNDLQQSPTLDMNWIGLGSTALSGSPSHALSPSQHNPISPETYKYLYHAVAVPAMRVSKDYASAFSKFKEANDIHILLHNRPSADALYNMACCFSLGAARVAETNGADLVKNLPPTGVFLAAQLIERRLDHAIAMLSKALDAGYTNASSLLMDQELRKVRDLRQPQIASLVRRLNVAAQAGLPQGGSVPMSLPSFQSSATVQTRLVKTDSWPQATVPQASITKSSLGTGALAAQVKPVSALRQSSLNHGNAAFTFHANALGRQTLPSRISSIDSNDSNSRMLASAAPTISRSSQLGIAHTVVAPRSGGL